MKYCTKISNILNINTFNIGNLIHFYTFIDENINATLIDV